MTNRARGTFCGATRKRTVTPSRHANAEPAMKLLYQTHSPYARKALVFAHECGLADSIEVIHHETSPTRRNEAVYAENPLGKVPVLLRPGKPPLFDSEVICAYLDTLHDGRRLIPTEGEVRWQALREQALAQDLAAAGTALRWETVRRPEAFRYRPLQDGQALKLISTYDWLERELDFDAPIHIGHIAIATTLSWLEFRELPGVRASRPRLTAWFDEFAARPSMRATPLSGETHD
jgi:glutathione S-transferase